jgi:two-component system, LytTR family, sensor kinase
MSEIPAAPAPARQGPALLLLIWTVVSLMSLAPGYLHYAAAGEAVPWSRMWSEVLGWWLWVLLFPAILWLARRFPIERRRWRASLPVHVAAGSALAVLYALLVVVKNQVILSLGTGDFEPHLWSQASSYVFGGFHFYLLVYGMIATLVHAFEYHRRYRERELQATRLQARLSQTELQVLKMQLDPHFLFNALNAVSTLVQREPEAAERMIGLLGDFLRLSLRYASRPEVRLDQELELLDLYLEIERVRFGERLRVAMTVAPELRAARVPTLLLQPLVENAIRHGMRERAAALEIAVAVRAPDPRWLELEVRDNGPGLPAAGVREGVGLSNTRARLEQLYGTAHRFELQSEPGAGARVTVRIPYHGDEPAAVTAGPSLPLASPAPRPQPSGA